MKNKKSAKKPAINFSLTASFLFVWVLVFIPGLGGEITVFGAATATGGTTATTTEVTQFLPSIQQKTPTQGNDQTRQILELFRGIIPNSTIDSFSKGSTVTTTAPSVSVGVSPTDVFTKNLKLGDTDSQVLLLQKALNEDIDTVISTTGAGSPGNETNYFGQKTKTAVIKLQNKHAGEVLIPNGLTSGTGYFGNSTRAMMNNIQKNQTKTTVSSTVSLQGESSATTIPRSAVSGLGEKVKIESLSPTHGKSGTVVTIRGTGMTKTANRIVAGGKTTYNVASVDGKTLTFTMQSPVLFRENSALPTASSTYIKEHFSELKTKKFPELKYPVCVLNDNGMSNCAFFILDI